MAIPGHFAIQDEIVHRQCAYCTSNRRQILRKSITRVELDVVAALVGEEADAIELALEHPVRSGEAILRQRRSHRLEPVGHWRRPHRSNLPRVCPTRRTR